MIACTSPALTDSDTPFKMVRSSSASFTCRFLISSIRALSHDRFWRLSRSIDRFHPPLDTVEALLDGGNIRMIVLLNRHDAGEMLSNGSHLGSHRRHPIRHFRHVAANGSNMFHYPVFGLSHYPTLPSKLMPISF